MDRSETVNKNVAAQATTTAHSNREYGLNSVDSDVLLLVHTTISKFSIRTHMFRRCRLCSKNRRKKILSLERTL